MNAARQYQLSQLDRTGWIFGLGGEQCIILATSVTMSGLALDAHLNPIALTAPIAIGLVIAFLRVGTLTVPQLVAVNLRAALLRASGLRTWKAVTEFTDVPFLRHLSLVEATENIGVVYDKNNDTLSASFIAATNRFLLLDHGDQDAVLSAWGDALTPLAASRAVTSVSWHETAGGSESALGHRITICVSVDLRHIASRRGISSIESGVETLRAETSMLADRLAHAGITVESPHTAFDIRALVAEQIAGHHSPIRKLTLGHIVRPINSANDFSGELQRLCIVVGNASHRTYWVESWPRTAVTSSWMESIIFSDEVRRTISLHMQPVSALDSKRRIDRSATKLETDATQRERAGFRVGDAHRRAAQSVADRETEIGDGYAEFNYSGFITLSSTSPELLRAHSAKWEQQAAASGIRLVALDGRHDLGLATSLPLGQAPLARRL